MSSSLELHRGQPELRARTFLERISCGLCTISFKYWNHRTWRKQALFPLDVRVTCTKAHNAGRADQSLLISLLPSHVPGFMMHYSLMMCYQVFACMHLLLRPYGSNLVLRGKDWPETNISVARTIKIFPPDEYLLVSKWQRTLFLEKSSHTRNFFRLVSPQLF